MRKHSLVKFLKNISLALVIAIVPQSAIANGFTQNAAGVKSFVFVNLPASVPTSMRIVGWPRDIVARPNACGLTVIAPSTGATISEITFPAASSVEFASLPVQTIPTCSAGVLAEPRTANFRTATGSVVLVSQSAGLPIRVIQEITRTLKANACGMARLAPPRQTFPNGWWFEGSSFVAAGQTLFADDLLGIQEKSICRKVGNQFLRYIPLVP